MVELPTGTVTLLFSDIEGSTALLSRLGPAYADALDGQRRVLRSAWSTHGGTELGTEGDSFFVVFSTAGDAVQAAAQAQVALAAFEWPAGELVKVRMGMHTGSPMVHGDGYVGMDVHRAARIAGAAHGGQVLVSSSTGELVESCLPGGLRLVDLGRHRLKDLPAPEHLFQLAVEGLRAEFPPVKSLGAASSLPVPATALVGRDGELAALTNLLRAPDTRLVTLTGAGGSGKTRLAIALATEQVGMFPDGVYFVSLAEVGSTQDMWMSMVEPLGLADEVSSAAALVAQLSHKQLLVVLDNLEQLVGAGLVVNELLTAAPRVKVVATSRRPLHVGGEHEHAVSPLDLPDHADLADAAGSAAVQLFCRQAQLVRPGFALTVDNVVEVVAICRRLDGLPLAVELAAARSKLLSPAALLERLGSTIDLAGYVIGRPARQQTLRDTIDWSYELLPTPLRAVLRRLGVFAGGADLAAVGAVAITNTDEGEDPLDAIAALMDVSLVGVGEGPDGEPRITLLQTIADFALDRLIADAEIDDARDGHARHYLKLAEMLAPQLWTGSQWSARQRLQIETDNFRSALTWTLEPDSPTLPPPNRAHIGLLLCAALAPYWEFHDGYVPESRRWHQRAIQANGGSGSRANSTVLVALAAALDGAPLRPQRLKLLDQALAISRDLKDHGGICEALTETAYQQHLAGNLSTATELLEQSITLAHESQDSRRLAVSLFHQGRVEMTRDNPADARESFEQARDLARQRGDETAVVSAELFIGECLAQSGQVPQAYHHLVGLTPHVVKLSNNLLTVNLLAAYAHVCAVAGDVERAARLLGANWAHVEKTGTDIEDESEEAWLKQTGLAAVRDTLGDQKWQQSISIGRAYTLDDALIDAKQARIPDK